MSDLTLVASHPHSFEAYRLLADGNDIIHRISAQTPNEERFAMTDSAASAFLRAAAVDSGFTLPLVMILEARLTAELEPQLQILREQRDDLPRWERAILDFHLAGAAYDYAGQYHAMLQVVSMAPSPTRALRLAQASIQSNRPGEALRILTELESERDWLGSAPGYWMWRVNAHRLLGDYEAVLSVIDRAREFLGQSSPLYTSEVQALARLGLVEEATDRSIEIIESTGHPRTQYLRYYLPRVLRSVGLDEQSRRVAEVGIASFSRIEGARQDYLAATLVCAGRYDEARQLLNQNGDFFGSRTEAFSLLAYMAAREGNAEEATRFSEMAVTARDPSGEDRSPYGMMSRVEVAASLGDNAGAVRFLREAIGLGLPHGPYIFTRWDIRPLQGYQPFEDLMRPKG
jgi:tetratricopeptide (TPR) repeat protein